MRLAAGYKIFFSAFMLISVLLVSFFLQRTEAQTVSSVVDSFQYDKEIKVTIDRPAAFRKHRPVTVIFYALPNGNTTAQTMGKKMEPGDDWHFDIQHISAQTSFLRQKLKRKNIVVVYLENSYKSWPAWKQKHQEFRTRIPAMVDSLAARAADGKSYTIHLNGHSGGGSFIFGYLASVSKIPSVVRRISFIDSNYGYDSSYYPVLKEWLMHTPGAMLNVFAYNDSVALYNGKLVVSATGGTWYRSWMMVRHLSFHWPMSYQSGDSIYTVMNKEKNIWFFFKPNPDRGIYHTQQVELNGFIHSALCGTRHDSKGYLYYGKRAYQNFIR